MQSTPPRKSMDKIDNIIFEIMVLSTLLSAATTALIKRPSLHLELGKSPLQDSHRRIFEKSYAVYLALQFSNTALPLERISGHTHTL